MRQISTILVFAGILSLQACNTVQSENPTITHYTSPKLSGLSPIRPYPNPDDVCQVVRENKTTAPFKTKGRAFIACPKHEKGAISDRRREGAQVVGNAKHWVILSIRENRVR